MQWSCQLPGLLVCSHSFPDRARLGCASGNHRASWVPTEPACSHGAHLGPAPEGLPPLAFSSSDHFLTPVILPLSLALSADPLLHCLRLVPVRQSSVIISRLCPKPFSVPLILTRTYTYLLVPLPFSSPVRLMPLSFLLPPLCIGNAVHPLEIQWHLFLFACQLTYRCHRLRLRLRFPLLFPSFLLIFPPSFFSGSGLAPLLHTYVQ